jgi:replicative DNA helicase
MRQMPHDIDAERAVLGSMMLDAKAVDEGTSRLAATDFYDPRHQEAFRAICALTAGSRPIDEVTVAGVVEFKGKGEYLANLTETTPTTANAGHYMHVVREKAARRAIIQAAREAAELAMTSDETPATIADKAAASMAEAVASHNEEVATPVKELLKAEVKRLERAQKGDVDRGLETGFYDIDRRLGGMHAADLIIVAGRPAMGKSSLADAMARGCALKGARVLAFNLEMGKPAITQRMIAAEGRVDLNRIRFGQLRDSDWVKTFNAANRLHPLQYSIATKADLSILKLRADARRWKSQQGGLDLIVVDYLQLMTSDRKDGNREREVAEISRGLKALAIELQIPIIALSQLNRGLEQRKDKRPMLSDLRESGAVEQDADAVLFVYRDDYYHPDTDDKGIAEIIFGKVRNGESGGEPARLRWVPESTRFENLQAA